jgi:hypothetical protein
VQLGRDAVIDDSRTLSSARTAAVVPRTRGLVAVVFLSDGRQNRGSSSRSTARGARGPRASRLHDLASARAAAVGEVAVSPAVECGFGFGRSPDPATLRQIARITGGDSTSRARPAR